MSCPNTIEIDGKKFVRAEPAEGIRHVAVLDRGWIFVGDLEQDGDTYHLRNAHNIRKWERNGFGGLVSDPTAARAQFDKSRDVTFKNPLFLVPVPDGWGGV